MIEISYAIEVKLKGREDYNWESYISPIKGLDDAQKVKIVLMGNNNVIGVRIVKSTKQVVEEHNLKSNYALTK